MLHSVWKPWANVEVSTWILAGLPWHIRIHRMETGRPLDAAEGEFSLGQEIELVQRVDPLSAEVSSAWGTSAVKGLIGYEKAVLVWPNANTNLFHPRTVLSTLTMTLEPGIHWLAAAVYGDPLGDTGSYVVEQSPETLLNVTFEKDSIAIITSGEAEIIIKRE